MSNYYSSGSNNFLADFPLYDTVLGFPKDFPSCQIKKELTNRYIS